MKRAELYTVRSEGPEGQWVETLVACGDDRSFWMEPDYLELRPAEMEIIRRAGPQLIRTEPRHRKVLVNVTAAIQLLSPRARQTELYIVASEHVAVLATAKPDKWGLA